MKNELNQERKMENNNSYQHKLNKAKKTENYDPPEKDKERRNALIYRTKNESNQERKTENNDFYQVKMDYVHGND